MIDDSMALEQVEVLEIELAAAREDEDAEEVRLTTDLLHELPRNVERRVRDHVDDGVSLIAGAEERELGGQLREHARRVAAAFALEPEEIRRGQLPGTRALHVVEA